MTPNEFSVDFLDELLHDFDTDDFKMLNKTTISIEMRELYRQIDEMMLYELYNQFLTME
jgi:hypothetical protein